MAKISPETRVKVLDAIRAGGKRNAIAREHGVAASTVTKIAQDAGLADAFDRSATENATRAAVADNKARRAVLARRFLDEAEAALADMRAPHLVYSFGGRDNAYNEHTLDVPPSGDRRNLMIIAATAVDKSMAIDRHDDDAQGLAAVDAWLRDITGGGA